MYPLCTYYTPKNTPKNTPIFFAPTARKVYLKNTYFTGGIFGGLGGNTVLNSIFFNPYSVKGYH